MITHKDLVTVAYKWVLKNTSCGVAFKELSCLTSYEIPDVIGFGSGTHSVLVEVKISRADFLNDKKKSFRINPELGMGSQRFFMVPEGLVNKEELPVNWGLVYVNTKLKPRLIYSPWHGNIGERKALFNKNIKAEHGIMYSALRRLHLRGRIEEIYTPAESLQEPQLF